MNGDQK